MKMCIDCIDVDNKMINKKNTTLSKQFQKLIEKSQKETKSITLTHKYMTTNTQIHDRLLSWLGAGTSI